MYKRKNYPVTPYRWIYRTDDIVGCCQWVDYFLYLLMMFFIYCIAWGWMGWRPALFLYFFWTVFISYLRGIWELRDCTTPIQRDSELELYINLSYNYKSSRNHVHYGNHSILAWVTCLRNRNLMAPTAADPCSHTSTAYHAIPIITNALVTPYTSLWQIY
jgi:hypothetical protein